MGNLVAACAQGDEILIGAFRRPEISRTLVFTLEELRGICLLAASND